MDPAYSIIVFTTASGAGYGLLVLVSLLAIGGVLPPTTGLGLAALGAAAALIAAGLSSSALHLGRPERALGAFSQWRSSWLAREGVAAVATFAPLGLFGIGWVFFNDVGGFFAWMAAACAFLALLTVSCTAMIYASLKPIRQWRNGFVLPAYLALGLYSGSLLLVLLTRMFGVYRPAFAVLAVILLGVAWAIKWGYWRHIDAAPAQVTLGAVTGLGRLGEVRLLEAPHTEANFVMREMGYRDRARARPEAAGHRAYRALSCTAGAPRRRCGGPAGSGAIGRAAGRPQRGARRWRRTVAVLRGGAARRHALLRSRQDRFP